MFDKTGTITHGKPRVTLFQPLTKKIERNVLIRIVGAAESASEHPLGQAVFNYAKEMLSTESLGKVTDFEAVPGSGIKCAVTLTEESGENANTNQVLIGNRTWMANNKVHVTKDVHRLMKEHEQLGKTAVLVAIDNVLACMLAIADELKAEAQEVVAHLKRDLGLHVVLLTGDNQVTAKAIAREVSVSFNLARILKLKQGRHHRRLRRSVALAQGRKGQRGAATGQMRRHGRRWRQRLARSGNCRCWHQFQNRHRCGG